MPEILRLQRKAESFGVKLRYCEKNVKDLRQSLLVNVQRNNIAFANLERRITETGKEGRNRDGAIAAAS